MKTLLQEKDLTNINDYIKSGGYKTIKKAYKTKPEKIVEEVKSSGLKGRGGAGFSTGMKWSFLPNNGAERYLVVNADESEPGTCKDMALMLNNPHLLLEGILISAYAINAKKAFLYIRGEVPAIHRTMLKALNDATRLNIVGEKSAKKIEIIIHIGAGAYICGEETALLNSLEGLRGEPRLKPPFPAIEGLYSKPTIINNVETIMTVPLIIENGAKWFSSKGTEQSAGFGLYSVSGHVRHPGQFECELGITLKELLKMAGGIRHNYKLKFWTPGGSSTPIFTEKHIDVPLSYEAVQSAGSMLGTRAIQVFDETTCVVYVMQKWMEFYVHESCGKCTPCREGTKWLCKVLTRIENGDGKKNDIKLLKHIADDIKGNTFCALGEGSILGMLSSLEYFEGEYLDHIYKGKCPFNHSLSRKF